MKKLLSVFLFLGMALLGFSQEPTPSGPVDFGDGKPDGTPPPTIKPRTLFPVTGNYTMSGVDLQFLADLGMAAVTVVNQTTGEQWFDLVDTASGVAHIDTTTSEPAGSYLIYIELEDGSSYWGEYVLI